jgi:hypothetical protein
LIFFSRCRTTSFEWEGIQEIDLKLVKVFVGTIQTECVGGHRPVVGVKQNLEAEPIASRLVVEGRDFQSDHFARRQQGILLWTIVFATRCAVSIAVSIDFTNGRY